MKFNPYPFEKLRELLKDSKPAKQGVNLSIGEPAFNAPKNVLDSICNEIEDIRKYPTLLDDLIAAQKSFVKRRFNIDIESIIPTFGSREVLFNFPHFLCLTRKMKSNSPIIAYPNPFYQIYEGAQIANNAKSIYMPLTEENNFKPHLDSKDLEKVDIVILNSPNNPTGQTLSLDELREWVRLALKYDFILINDECYSEIYEDNAPHSILEASLLESNSFKNVFAINSISKRLSAPGLRSGFIAGDSEVLNEYRIFRTYVGISMPLPLQKASIIAWNEDNYAEFIREKFSKNLKIAREIFPNENVFPYTFYLWLDTKEVDDTAFTKRLFENTGHIVLPGSYLGRENAGKNFVRIALTQENDITKAALLDIKREL